MTGKSDSWWRVGWSLWTIAWALGVMLFYAWTLDSARGDLRPGKNKRDYYNLLVDGFQDGRLSMKVDPDPALVALPPEKRPGDAPYLLDASLYDGRYYLYFGVVPAVLLHWPFAAFTGLDLPDALAVWVLASGALGLGVLWWRELRRQLWPALGPRLDWLAVLALGLGTGIPAVHRRPLFYEEATLAGWLFGAMMLWALLRAHGARGLGAGWLGLAGVACGLAAGSRANLVLAGVVTLALGAGLVGRRHSPEFRRGLLPALGVAGAGALAVGIGLGAYNYARFGSVLEFGHSYQLGHNPAQMFRLANLWHNLGLYYGHPPELNAYFPYVLPPAEGAKPFDYIGRESVHGEWIWLIAVVFVAPALCLAGRARLVWIVPMGCWFAGNLLVTGLLGVRANRYMLDFHPALVGLVLAGAGWIGRDRGRNRLWLAVSTMVVLLAAAFNVLAGFQVHGFFGRTDPVGFQRLGARMDALVWKTMPWVFRGVGDWETELRWPPAGSGGVMPLLTAGVPEFRDRLWLRLDGHGRAAFELNHGDYGTVLGPDFPYKPGTTVRLRLQGAMLLPPVWHRWYGGLTTEERTALRRRLRLWVDGVPVFDRDVPSFSSAPWLHQWTPLQHGAIEVKSPATAWLSGLADRRGSVRLSLLLPGDRFGSSEPLFQSGTLGAWDVVMVLFTRPGFIRLRHDSAGKGAVTSEEFAVDYAATHLVEIESPSAHDDVVWNRHDTLVPSDVGLLSVRWNGRPVFRSNLPPHPAASSTVTLGMNDFSSGCRASFAAKLVVAPRLEALPVARASVWRRTLADALVVDDRGVLLQWERSDRRMAAVVWRRRGDAMQIGWVDNGFVQWAEAAPPPAEGVFEFQVGPVPGAGASARADGAFVPYRLAWDGQELLAGDTDFFGQEPIAGHGLDAAGWLAEPWREPIGTVTEDAAGPARRPGRITMHLALPSDGLRESAPLLTAGRTGRADAIYLRPVGPDTYVVGVDHWGVAAYESERLQLSPGKKIEAVLELGSLFDRDPYPPDRVRVVLDGVVVLDVRTSLHPVGPGEVWIGRNTLGFSTCGAVFPGQIFSVRHRTPLPADAKPVTNP